MTVKKTQVAVFLDFVGFRGVCKECQEPIWYIRDKRNNTPMYTVELVEHKHEKKKEPVEKIIEQEKRSPGGKR